MAKYKVELERAALNLLAQDLSKILRPDLSALQHREQSDIKAEYKEINISNFIPATEADNTNIINPDHMEQAPVNTDDEDSKSVLSNF